MRSASLWIVVLAGCQSAPAAAPAASDDEAARAAAQTFLQCYERDGAECRPDDAPIKEWATVSALSLVRDGLPTEIFVGLPRALVVLQDEANLRRSFIQTLSQNHGRARAGACEIRRIDVIGPRAVALGQAASARIERLGFEGTESGEAVTRLADTVRAVAGARLVQIDCKVTHASFYLVFAQNDDKAWRLCGFYPTPPMWFRLEEEPPQPTTRVRLAPANQNLVDPWLPLYEEQF